MKKNVLLLLSVVAASTMTTYGQGSFGFNNYLNLPAPAPATLVVVGQAARNIGADFTASLFWAAGNVSDPSSLAWFQAADVSFFGVTGGTPTTDGAGLFDHAVVVLPTTGTVTLQVRAWQTGAGVNGWANALVRGESNLIQLDLATGTTPPPNMNGLLPFTVQAVPEPSTFALLGLGTGALLFFRRRK